MRRADHKRRRHSWDVHLRAFSIWRNLGFLPWRKPRDTRVRVGNKESGDFYKGAFDSIPFLNDDAKRTFQHLLLRPGYMIRDYIRGDHDRYLAPLTSLIIFYAFFALIAALLQPVQHRNRLPFEVTPEMSLDSAAVNSEVVQLSQSIVQIVRQGYLFLHLDQHPEAVKTQRQSALAALEGTLRSQGIPLFIGEFLFLWLAMSLALRRQKVGMSACAAASAYVLCQFSFFMLFAVVLTWGKSSSISILLMLVLLWWDYRQWLNLSWKKSIHLTLRTGIIYGIIYGLVILLISALVLVIALIKVRT